MILYGFIAMKYYALKKGDNTEQSVLRSRFEEGHQIGAVCVGKEHLFARKGLKTYYIAYRDADRIYKRVRMVTANVCCEGGEFRFDYLVIEKDGKELLEVQLPDEKAGRILFGELKEAEPECELTAPDRGESAEE